MTAFKIYLPAVPRQDVNHGELPWVYDQDPASGNVASMWVTPVKSIPPERPWVMLEDEKVTYLAGEHFYEADTTVDDIRRAIQECSLLLKEKNT